MLHKGKGDQIVYKLILFFLSVESVVTCNKIRYITKDLNAGLKKH